MTIRRRELLKASLAGSALLGTVGSSHATSTPTPKGSFRRIAVEEFFTTPELLLAQRKLLGGNPSDEPGFTGFWGQMMDGIGFWDVLNELVGGPGSVGLTRALSLGDGRIEAMDAAGIDMQLLSVTSPGVQVYDAAKGSELAQSVNERLAEAVQEYPDRFAGLATIAPQDPQGAARELDRAVRQLGMKGALINSHTKGEFLDDEKYWVILEKAQALDVPIYIHPRTPAPDMLPPFQKYFGLEAAAFGFNVDAGLHALRMILGGVFDQFPKLKIVLGHMGEGLPFWLPRIDKKMALFAGFKEPQPRLQKKPSEYFLENFYITTSGMNYEQPLKLALEVVGADRSKIYHLNAERVFSL